MGSMWSTNVALEIGQGFTLPDTVRWRGERTGPHGGLKYRLCKICDPEVPLA